MRITNRIITNNSLSNINRVKTSQDKLNTMLSTGKKITKPSDDPVIAIRALRLRSEASKVDQYYEKNSKDAEAWLKSTDTALDTVSGVLTDMLEQVEKGASDTYDTKDKLVVVEQLNALAEEIYSTGDSDYAGRYLFTGYRTDTPLTFQKDTTLQYEITEQLDKSNISVMNHVFTDDLLDYTTENYTGLNADEQSISKFEVYRIQLAYNDVDSTVAPTITYTDTSGALQTITADITPYNSATDPYTSVAADKVNYIPETGELILGADVYKTLMDTNDSAATETVNEGEIKINYQKTNWSGKDLRPEHYFACTSTDADGKSIEFNQDYLTGEGRQVIEYTTGTGQAIQINTLASETFNHDIKRLAADITSATELLSSIDSIVTSLEKIVENGGLSGTALTTAEDKLAAAKKAQSEQKEVVKGLFEGAITKVQGFLDRNSLASTNCGSRASRLSLIQNRLSNQQTTMDTLVSENEDCDETEVAIELKGAELCYEAALLATSKITQTSLLNYI